MIKRYIEVIDELKKFKHKCLRCESGFVRAQFVKIFKFVEDIEANYSSQLEELKRSVVRYCDYLYCDKHGKEILKNFYDQYQGVDKGEQLQLFMLYKLLRDLEDFNFACEFNETPEEAYQFVWTEHYFQDINCEIDFLEHQRQKKEARTSGLLSFLDEDNKYKTYFTDSAVEDIEILDPKTKKIVLKKLSKELATEDFVPHAENIAHVKERYDFPILRIWVGDDYRLAYVRRGKVTAIIGVTMKSGKDADYTRYDKVARNKEKIYSLIDAFESGKLPKCSRHYQLVDALVEEFVDESEE